MTTVRHGTVRFYRCNCSYRIVLVVLVYLSYYTTHANPNTINSQPSTMIMIINNNNNNKENNSNSNPQKTKKNKRTATDNPFHGSKKKQKLCPVTAKTKPQNGRVTPQQTPCTGNTSDSGQQQQPRRSLWNIPTATAAGKENASGRGRERTASAAVADGGAPCVNDHDDDDNDDGLSLMRWLLPSNRGSCSSRSRMLPCCRDVSTSHAPASASRNHQCEVVVAAVVVVAV
mmetsp:Transcript_11635/g.22974  ORF Transcript_11635/g.22974 Transcript_11635/m.22974 type:complete len:230 (+) Transcript_11635:2507-3196(+)